MRVVTTPPSVVVFVDFQAPPTPLSYVEYGYVDCKNPANCATTAAGAQRLGKAYDSSFPPDVASSAAASEPFELAYRALVHKVASVHGPGRLEEKYLAFLIRDRQVLHGVWAVFYVRQRIGYVEESSRRGNENLESR